MNQLQIKRDKKNYESIRKNKTSLHNVLKEFTAVNHSKSDTQEIKSKSKNLTHNFFTFTFSYVSNFEWFNLRNVILENFVHFDILLKKEVEII